MASVVDDFYQAVADHTGDAVIFVDADGVVQFWKRVPSAFWAFLVSRSWESRSTLSSPIICGTVTGRDFAG